MQKLLIFLLSSIMFLIGTKLQAANVIGADITYTCDSAYVYTFKIVFYRYCGGIPFSDPSDSTRLVATKTKVFEEVSLTRQSIIDVTPLCNTATSGCDPANTSETGEGIEAHTYTVHVDFKKAPYNNLLKNGNCEVRLETGLCCRSDSITTGAANKRFYTFAQLDLCKATTNNSPQFVKPANASVCCYQPIYTMVGAHDILDNDSLSYSFAHPLEDFNKPIAFNSSNYKYYFPFQSYYPGYLRPPYTNINANPPIGIYLDKSSGYLVWTPSNCDEVTVAVLEIKEWRRDSSGTFQVIGTTRRDMQFTTINCPGNNPPRVSSKQNIYIEPFTWSTDYCFKISTDDKVRRRPDGSSPPPDTVKFDTPDLPKGFSFNINSPNALHQSANVCIDITEIDRKKLTKNAFHLPFTVRDNTCPQNSVTSHLVRFEFDKSIVGKIVGSVIDDQDSNCTLDTTESNLYRMRKIGFSRVDLDQKETYNGKFELFLDTGTTEIKLLPNPWFDDHCASQTIQVQYDSIYPVQFYSKLKYGISGYVFTNEGLCAPHKNARPFQNQKIAAQPGKHIISTDNNGYYNFHLPPGKYTISPLNDTTFWSSSTCGGSQTVVLNKYENIQIDTFWNTLSDVSDLSVSIGFNNGNRVQRGSDCIASLNITNKWTSPIDTVIITVQTDDDLVNLSKSWVSLGSGKYESSFYNVQPTEIERRSLFLNTHDTSYGSGDTILFDVISDIRSKKKDYDSTNNKAKSFLRIVAPYDPNLKTAQPDSIFTTTNRSLTYTVQFQNEGNASAIDVVVRDTISDLLDLSSFELLFASHKVEYIIEGKHIWFFFEDINLPPKSTDLAGSSGSVRFKINLLPNIREDVFIKNRVGIYFDFEDVVLTDYQINHFKSPIEFIDTLKPFYCHNDTLLLPFLVWFKPNSDNKFILEMTDLSGAFSTFAPVDSMQSNQTKNSFAFPISNIPTSGNGYRFRIRSTSPQTEMFITAYSDSISTEILKTSLAESSNTVICQGSSIIVKPTENFYNNTCYLNGKAILSGSSVTYTTDSMSHGDYVFFKHATKLGCYAFTDTVNYTVFAKPTISINTVDSIYCDSIKTVHIETATQYSDGFVFSDTVVWNFGDGSTWTGNTSDKRIAHNYTTGKHDMLVSVANGICSDSASTRIYVGVKPNPSLIAVTSEICQNEPLNIVVKKNSQFKFKVDSSYWDYGDGSTYISDDGSSQPYKFSNAGEYIVKYVMYSQTCMSDTLSLKIKVHNNPKGTIIPKNFSACLPNAEFSFKSNISGYYRTVKWVTDTNEYFSDTFTTTYTTIGQKIIRLIVANTRFCIDTSSVTVNVNEQPVASFELKTSDGFGIEINNSSIRSNRHYWTIDTTNFENNDATFQHFFTQNGDYIIRLIAESVEGCLDTIEDIATIAHDYVFHVPNTFSPNNDGLNETFNLVPNDLIKTVELRLYDRFGVMVVKSKDKNNLIYKDLVPGVYLLNIDIIAIDGRKHVYSGVLHVW
ncbi:MAG: putative repeat protein (TIGR01451 family) [bacterium]|jgi:uncharacterized repeat protein (TIGR01451 family)